MTRHIRPCVHGGDVACTCQGGSGEASHAVGYTHPIPTLDEVGAPAGDVVHPLQKGAEYSLPGLEEFFDDDFSKSVLGVSLDTAVHARDVVKKSLYDFDLESKEGVLKLLGLVPIMDREILADIAGEIWPGYPSQDLDPKLLRLEIKGYMMDYLDGHGTQESQTAPEELGDPEPAGDEEGQEEAPTDGGGEPDAEAAPEPGADGAEGAPAEGEADAEPAPGQGSEA